jgi:hypothetical protein
MDRWKFNGAKGNFTRPRVRTVGANLMWKGFPQNIPDTLFKGSGIFLIELS